jgi:hypothetical protein
MRQCNCEQAQELRRQIEELQGVLRTLVRGDYRTVSEDFVWAKARALLGERPLVLRNLVIPDSMQIDAPAEGETWPTHWMPLPEPPK